MSAGQIRNSFTSLLNFSATFRPVRVSRETILGRRLLGVGAFILRAQGIGFFPNEQQPRVIWVGFEDSENVFADLQTTGRAFARATCGKTGRGKFSPAHHAGPLPKIPPLQNGTAPAARADASTSCLWRMAGGGSRPFPQRTVAGRRAAQSGCVLPLGAKLER